MSIEIAGSKGTLAAAALAVVMTILTALTLCIWGCSGKEPPGKTVIRFVTWQPNRPEVWDEIIRNFEKRHPNIKVEREVGPQSSTAFHDLLTQKLKNRSKDVDVFFMDVTWPPEFASAGWALPLDDKFPASEQQKFLKGPITADTYNGRIYGVPVFVDAGMLFYRSDLLEKYGYSPPVTWEEMVAQAEKIVQGEREKSPDLTGYTAQFKQYEGLVCNMMEFILSNGGHVLDPKTGKIALMEKRTLDAVSFVRNRVIGRAASRGALTYQEPESMDLFAQGKAVFLRNWPYAWEVSNNPETSKVSGKVGIARLPHFTGGESRSILGGWQLGISSYSNNKDAAWKFVEFVTGEDAQKLIALKIGKAPGRKALFEDKDVLKANPQFSDMKEVFLSASPRPRTPLYPAVSNILQRFFSSAISDPSSDMEVQAKKASSEIDKLLQLVR